MNFSRSFLGVPSAISVTKNPVSNRFVAAMLATFAALMISMLGSSQWASADSGDTVPDPDPPPTTSAPGAPRHVIAKSGDESAAVAWFKPAVAEDGIEVEIDGYIVTASPSGISVEAESDDTLIVVSGLENGVEYTFTVVALNDGGSGAVSESSNPITPEEGLELNEENLKRLRAEMHKRVHDAQERIHEAEERAREKLAEVSGRVDEQLIKQTDRANEHLSSATEKANQQNATKTEQARNWFAKLQEQLREKLERAEGTDRYEDLRARADEQLDKAGEKLTERLDKSQAKTDERIARAEEHVEKRLGKAEERAENTLPRTEERLTKNVSRMKDQLQKLIHRLRNLWLERAASQS
jgi:hypothetical protein